jgi:sentrin-specific protease 1
MITAAGNLLNHRRKRHLEDPPLPRHFHGPQRPCRIRLSFCPGASFTLLPPEARSLAFDMGNFVSRLFGGHPRDDGLGMYKGWVGALQEAQDLTVATTEEAGTTAHLVSRKFGDPRKSALEAVPRPQKRTKPHYRDALKASRKNDSRLEELAFEVKLYEEKLAELRKSDQAPKEVNWFLFGLLLGEMGEDPGKVCIQYRISGRFHVIRTRAQYPEVSSWNYLELQA